MSNQNTAIQKSPPQSVQYTTEQIQTIKDTVCKGATDAELRMFLHNAERRGFDPLAGQIHAVKRWDDTLKRYVMAIQTGIDAYRLNAQRSGEYDGQDGPFWCGPDGEWKEQWLTKEPPVAAKVVVYRKGISRAFVGVARFEAYVQTTRSGEPNSRWKKAGDGQLAKCAEALALRRAFPEELGGIHINEEMEHLDNETKEPSKLQQIQDAIDGKTPKPLVHSEHEEAVYEDVKTEAPAPQPDPDQPPFPVDAALEGDALRGQLIAWFFNQRKISPVKLEEYLDTPRKQWTEDQMKRLYEIGKEIHAGTKPASDFGLE